MEGPILLVFVNSFLKDCWSSRLTKFKAFVTFNLDHGYMIYDETCNTSMHHRFEFLEIDVY